MKNPFCYEDTNEMIRTVKIEPTNDYCLRVFFSNGKIKIYDVKPLLNDEVYAPLKNKSLFDSVYVACSSAAWDDDIDICPESLYWESVTEA
jgi:hypothetical protein